MNTTAGNEAPLSPSDIKVTFSYQTSNEEANFNNNNNNNQAAIMNELNRFRQGNGGSAFVNFGSEQSSNQHLPGNWTPDDTSSIDREVSKAIHNFTFTIIVITILHVIQNKWEKMTEKRYDGNEKIRTVHRPFNLLDNKK